MPGHAAAAYAAPSIEHLHATFLSILPRIELHGRVYFRHKRPNAREELIAEMVGLSWKWFVRLVERGKDPTAFVSALATFAARAVNSGRRVCGQERAKEVLSASAQKRHGFVVEKLPTFTRTSREQLYASPQGQRLHDDFEDRLRDNTVTPVIDQVQFRIDFPAWLATLTPRERRIVRDMANNERTLDLSRRFEVSPARISQLRREFHNEWRRYCGELAPSVT